MASRGAGKGVGICSLLLLAFCADGERGQTRHPPLNEQPQQPLHPNGQWPNSFPVRLRTGEFLQAAVHQKGIDVVARLIDPEGRTLFEEDSPTGDAGSEMLVFVAPQDGVYQIEIWPFEEKATDGSFEVELQAIRPATESDQGEVFFAEANRLEQTGELKKALNRYQQALSIFKRLEQPLSMGKTLIRMGGCALRLWDETRSISLYRQGLEVYSATDLRQDSIDAQIELGRAFNHFGYPDESLDAFSQAREDAARVGYRTGQAVSLVELGALYREWGETDKAVEAFQKGIQIGDALDDWQLANLKTELGRTLSLANRLEEARTVFAEALQAWQRARSKTGQATVITEIGWLEHLQGRHRQAIEHYQKALNLAGGDSPQSAGTWDRLGTAYRWLGKPAQARQAFSKAMSLMQGRRSPFETAHTLNNLAEACLDLKEPQQALTNSQEAAKLFERSRQPHAHAHALFVGAKAALALGRWQEGKQRLEEVLTIVESLRYKMTGRSWRSSFQGSRYFYFEGYWNALAAFPPQLQGEPISQAGFEALERIRSLTLREWMSEKDSEPESRARQEEIRIASRVQALDRQKTEWEQQGRPASRLASIEEEIRRLLEQVDHLASPAPPAVSLEEVQQRLLDEETVLLAYALGEVHSFLWVVSKRGIEMHILPGRQRIEGLARHSHRLLGRPTTPANQGQSGAALSRLAEVLLKKAIPSLAPPGEPPRRILVMADGALHYLPFGLLRASGHLLLEQHEIVMIPSAGTLLDMSQQPSSPAPKLLAVVADPVFGPWDPRVPFSGEEDPFSIPFPRLPFNQALQGLAPSDQTSLVLGLEATRRWVIGPQPRDYSIIHFGTHGIFHPLRPQLSHILLSVLDERGQPIAGILRAHEISQMEINAQLVTLSACESGKGEEILGEGVLGLAHSFMVAGASRVLVSLWKVHKQATDELMQRFYKGILHEKKSPPAALQAAQLSMSREPKWASPYYWAGFVLLGDWQPIPQLSAWKGDHQTMNLSTTAKTPQAFGGSPFLATEEPPADSEPKQPGSEPKTGKGTIEGQGKEPQKKIDTPSQ